MKFVDQVRVFVEAGRGGDGMVAWRREKYVPRGGPAGGDGGRGGSIVLEADPGLSTLLDLRFNPYQRAEPGRPGQGHDKNGRSGVDKLIRVPVGTTVVVCPSPRSRAVARAAREGDEPDEPETVYVGADGEFEAAPGPMGEVAEPPAATHPPGTVLGDLTSAGDTLVVAQGGRGGRGNIHFRTSTRQAPDFAEPGELGESMWLQLELKLLADVGIVGFPNVGKSTFIGRVSRARPKVAAYPFTTLVPQLGVVAVGDNRSMVVADVPGLIEGASDGRGLGLQFLRHLERTRVLLHMLAPDPSEGRDPLVDLDALEAELRAYGPVFADRPRVVALNKLDLLRDDGGRERVAGLRGQLRNRNIPLFVISAATGEGIPRLLEALWRRLDAVRTAESKPS